MRNYLIEQVTDMKREDCIDRHVYFIRSRNLTSGVYRAGTAGFMGIREKFGSLYLFEEYHWDQSPHVGTVRPQLDLGELPEEIEVRESYDTECEVCGQPCKYSQEMRKEFEAQGFKPGSFPRSPWQCEGPCEEGNPTSRTYRPLFDFMQGVDLMLRKWLDLQEPEYDEWWAKSNPLDGGTVSS